MNHSMRVPQYHLLKSAICCIAALAVLLEIAAAEDSSNKTFRVVQMCDTQLGFGGYDHDVKAFKQAVKQINALQPDLVLICGDLVNTPDEKSFADFNKIKAGFLMPCHPVPGNHDVGNVPTQASLQYYRKVVGRDYYSFEHKGYTFVLVNTQLWKSPVEGETEKLDAWLKETLKTAAAKRSQIVVVGHYPLFLEKPDEAEQYYNLPPARRGELLGLFENAGVVAMLAGHTHKLIINEHKGIQMVNGETTSKNFDNRPFGFRLWHFGSERPFKHEYVPLEFPPVETGSTAK